MTGCAGVILAGGRATRMGGRDKAFLPLAGSTLVARCIQRFAPQVQLLAINSNADASAFLQYGEPVIADADETRPGPLAGILAGMRWAGGLAQHPGAIVTVAVDTPFFPTDLVARLTEQSHRFERIAMSTSAGSLHPTFALWPVALADDLDAIIAEGMSLSVRAFAERHGIAPVDFPAADGQDPFFNINTPEDLQMAEAIAGGTV